MTLNCVREFSRFVANSLNLFSRFVANSLNLWGRCEFSRFVANSLNLWVTMVSCVVWLSPPSPEAIWLLTLVGWLVGWFSLSDSCTCWKSFGLCCYTTANVASPTASCLWVNCCWIWFALLLWPWLVFRFLTAIPVKRAQPKLLRHSRYCFTERFLSVNWLLLKLVCIVAVAMVGFPLSDSCTCWTSSN